MVLYFLFFVPFSMIMCLHFKLSLWWKTDYFKIIVYILLLMNNLKLFFGKNEIKKNIFLKLLLFPPMVFCFYIMMKKPLDELTKIWHIFLLIFTAHFPCFACRTAVNCFAWKYFSKCITPVVTNLQTI